MKLRAVGHKISDFGNKLGQKLYAGAKSIGQKVYDNRYKLLATAGAGIGATLLGGAVSAGNALANAGAIQGEIRDKFPKMTYPSAYPYNQPSAVKQNFNPLFDFNLKAQNQQKYERYGNDMLKQATKGAGLFPPGRL